MPQEAPPTAATPSTFPRGRSLIARFKTPLANWNRTVADFQIEPDDPWRSYTPGDIVTGSVILTVIKPIRITHLVVCLHGHAKVFKTQIGPGEPHTDGGFIGAGRGRRGIEDHGNGFVTLFEDEMILCGEGRLKEGVYKFKFESQFPTANLPSSIEFERGVVGYHITATVTRPTTIAPTLSCGRKLHFQDTIDIAHVVQPKPKIISLEPITKRGRVKSRALPGSTDQHSRMTVPRISRRNTDTSTSIRTTTESVSENLPENRPPRSPALSETSTASIATDSSQSFRVVQQAAPSITGNSIKSGEPRTSLSSASDTAITATTEILKPGALPGDTIPIKVFVKHTKPTRGIALVTLYRQGRIEMHPGLPVGTLNKGKAAEYEHIYPRSKTGLGGLHFSSGSPSSVFRKDLSQSTAPMIINPTTLTAEVKASVRLPEDAFPTIINVPGAMIMFKYFVEVVIDLCGKLNESRLLPKLSLTTPSSTFAAESGFNLGRNLTSNWADRIIDTDPIRRTKTIVSCVFDLIVGSKDSTRVVKQGPDEAVDTTNQRQDGSDQQWEEYYDQWTDEEWRAYYANGYEYDDYWQDHGPDHHPPPPHQHVPPPMEEHLDEKARLRREEELLLPSRPPQEEESGPSSNGQEHATDGTPSAPLLFEEDGNYMYSDTQVHPTLPDTPRPTTSGVSTRSVETVIRPNSSQTDHDPPVFEGTILPTAMKDDKQELERRRLIAEASAPPVSDGEGHAGQSSSAAATDDTPSAPALNEEDEYNILSAGEHHEMNDGEHLPQYRR